MFVKSWNIVFKQNLMDSKISIHLQRFISDRQFPHSSSNRWWQSMPPKLTKLKFSNFKNYHTALPNLEQNRKN
ncbi:hypothetical protein BpHYR1_030975 [Brachionus plicatilis]|uniref:Uncharacterized protein n=1 Tax=Brachionus plicatilis TaxID=10195 RepID=A0A3M7SW80_BRAPC|nr:hypothetical protein BpHYR1_030975 [Brachionus plicatilis]